MKTVSGFKYFFHVDKLEPLRVVQGGLLSSSLLTVLRFFISCYYLLVLIFHIVYGPDDPLFYIVFLTFLDFYGLLAYLFVTTYFSIRHYFNRSFIPWQGQHWIFKFLYTLLYEVSICLTFIVTVVYWILLAKSDLIGKDQMYLFLSISYHAFNYVIVMLEVILGNNPLFFRHFLIVMFVVLLYIPYAFLLHAIYGFWPYDFLDYENNPIATVVTILGIFVISLFYYTLMWFVHSLRDRFNARHHNKPV